MYTKKPIFTVLFVLAAIVGLSLTTIGSDGQSKQVMAEVIATCTPYECLTPTITPTIYYTPIFTTTPIPPFPTVSPFPSSTPVCGSYLLGIECTGNKGYSYCHVVNHSNGKVSYKSHLNATAKNFFHHFGTDGIPTEGHEYDYVIVTQTQLDNCN